MHSYFRVLLFIILQTLLFSSKDDLKFGLLACPVQKFLSYVSFPFPHIVSTVTYRDWASKWLLRKVN